MRESERFLLETAHIWAMGALLMVILLMVFLAIDKETDE